MKTLIKWPGGKEREFNKFKPFIPLFDRYIEPFFGGGAVFFNLDTTQREAFVNDISSDLITFYELVQANDEEFRTTLYNLLTCWENSKVWLGLEIENILNLYIQYRDDEISTDELITAVQEKFETTLNDSFSEYFTENITIDNTALKLLMEKNLIDKLQRVKKLEIKNGQKLDEEDLFDNIESGIKSGFYVHIRNIHNKIILEKEGYENLSPAYKSTVFYYMREYCYGSMFRYNAAGEFNIPYGGISYSKKDFKRKIAYLFSPEVQTKFQQVNFRKMDFEDFLNSIELTENDFIFLDPPYDSDFSDYEGRSFAALDQRRLANLLYTTKAKFMLVIKNTDFIFDLYNDKPGIHLFSFDKQYTYNVRGRNERDVEHLVITNYELSLNQENDSEQELLV